MRLRAISHARGVALIALIVIAARSASADPHVAPEDVTARTPAPARNLRTLVHDPAGYDPQRTTVATDLLLGDLLFHAPAVLGAKAEALGISCNTCHPNGAANTSLALGDLSDRPGNVDLTTSHFRVGADNHRADFVNIPSLRGARFTGPYGHDGRTASLPEFTNGVVADEFGGPALSPRALSALVKYVQDLDFVPNANLDLHGRLTAHASADAHRGEALFEKPRAAFGGKSCASCHPASSYFRDGQTHRIGSGALPSPHALEDGYETPTLLGTVETAPYFHDGKLGTLADVVLFFDTQFALGLTSRDRADLSAYLGAIGAIDRAADDRPLAERMIGTFVYLELCIQGESADDRRVWTMALDLAHHELAAHPPSALAARVQTDDGALASLRGRVASGAPLEPMRGEVKTLARELTRLAADWQGALAP